MGLETAQYIEGLDENWPLGTDPVSRGDDHLRLIKSVLKNQFPNLGDEAVTATAEQINASAVPTGTIFLRASVAIPAGWLRCNGQEVSRSEYASLYSLIGDTYGEGNGSTTFNLPNLNNSVPAGATGANPAGLRIGKDSWTQDDLPAHQHTVTGGEHTHTIKTASDSGSSGSQRYASSLPDTDDDLVMEASGGHSHTFAMDDFAGETADNRQQTLYIYYLIKT